MNRWFLILLVSAFGLRAGAQTIPLAEHPRPDFARSEWINLNGRWAFTFNERLAEQAIAANRIDGFDRQIMVPFGWSAPLSGVANESDKGWYARVIALPDAWRGKRIFLVIGAADWHTRAWIDGKPLGEHQGGYTPFEFELTPYVAIGVPHNLFISVDDTPSEQRLYGKQGYGDVRGIWQTVYLEARGANYINYLHFSPDIDHSTVDVEVSLKEPPAKNTRLCLRFRNGEQTDLTFRIKEQGAKSVVQQFEVKLSKQRLWSLDDPYLYEIEATLLESKREMDRVNAYFGQRKISVAPLPSANYPYIALNNTPVYLQACLDQSYHPDGFYTFPSDAFMRDEILLSKRLGLNAHRIHIKAELPRKLYWADRLGLLIMADIPNFWGDPDAQARQDWEYCLHNQIKRDYNHPSIFAWVNFNETWGLWSTEDGQRAYHPATQEWVRSVYRETKRLDPTRLVEDNSPCNADHVETDLNTWHGYYPGYKWKEILDYVTDNTYVGSAWNYIGDNRQTGAPMLNSECGNVWGYAGSTGDVDFSWDYHIMMNEFRSHPLCAGWLYTEHHDVINEWNGYVHYDRTPKIDGLDAFVPGMSLADLHSPYYVAPQGELCRDVTAGAVVDIPLFASFMTDQSPGAIYLETRLQGVDTLGKEVAEDPSRRLLTFKPFMNEPITPLQITAPQKAGLYTLQLQLKNAEGKVLGRNFVLLRVNGDVVSNEKMRAVTFDPAQPSAAQWSRKQWNVLNGLKVNGAGSGYFEYTLSWPEGLKMKDIASITLALEASAKELFAKDTEGIDSPGVDYMRGGGADHRSKNNNAYPMTDQTTFPSFVRISVNSVVCTNHYLPDDPADHRGILSWHAQPKDGTLHEAGSYGYLLKTLVPLHALIEGQPITLRLETPEGIDGGLAIYGKDFGRYPLAPTLIFSLR